MELSESARDRSLLDAALRGLPMPAFVIGADDAVLARNPAAEALIAAPHATRDVLRFKELPISYQIAGLRAAVERVKTGPDQIESQPAVNGPERRLHFSVWPLRVGTELLGVVVTIEDRAEVETLRSQLAIVTDDLHATSEQMEQTNEELRVANEELHDANVELQSRLDELQSAQEAIRNKDDFLAMLAHEMRNPLAPILSAAHILAVRPDDPAAVQRAREVIERQVRHQARLLDDLLDVSRITRGRIELRRRPVDLASIVAETMETTRPLIDARHLEISGPAASEAVLVEADPVRLAQIVANLLTNAVKYTPPGGRIAIKIEREGPMALLRVRDSGIGIPGPHARAHLRSLHPGRSHAGPIPGRARHRPHPREESGRAARRYGHGPQRRPRAR